MPAVGIAHSTGNGNIKEFPLVCVSGLPLQKKHKRCDKPLEVCFYTNDVADKKVEQGSARRVSLEQASETLKLANQHGLVHLTIYNPEQHVYALCSCCECCCHDIEFMKKLGRPDLVAHADYVASVDDALCNHCGGLRRPLYVRCPDD